MRRGDQVWCFLPRSSHSLVYGRGGKTLPCFMPELTARFAVDAQSDDAQSDASAKKRFRHNRAREPKERVSLEGPGKGLTSSDTASRKDEQKEKKKEKVRNK